jgi:hypothetical protein
VFLQRFDAQGGKIGGEMRVDPPLRAKGSSQACGLPEAVRVVWIQRECRHARARLRVGDELRWRSGQRRFAANTNTTS